MQRQVNTTRVATAHSIDMPEISQQPKPVLRITEENTATTDHILPLYKRNSGEFKRSRRAENFAHLIPVVVFLCLFILWWFSYPVQLEIKDGRITAVYQVVTQNVPFLRHTNLATVSAPYPTISEVVLMMISGSVEEPASSFVPDLMN